MGKLFIFLGIVLLALGLLITYGQGYFGWFGHLPGDIRIEKGNNRFFFPITSMILLSVALSVVVTIVINLFFPK